MKVNLISPRYRHFLGNDVHPRDVTKSSLRISHRNDSSAFWLVLVASSVLLHGLLLVLSAHLAELFSVQTKTQDDLTPVEIVELPPEPTLEKLTNDTGAASPVAPAQIDSGLSPASVELGVPESLPPVPSQASAPTALPAPVPSSVPLSPTPTPVSASPVPASPTPSTLPASPVPVSPTPAPSLPSVSPSPLPTTPPSTLQSPPTANVQPIEQSAPTVLPETGNETAPEESLADPSLNPVAIDPEAIPAQVQMTLAIADSAASAEGSLVTPVGQQWVFEPNPITSGCPAMTPSVVRQFGTLVTLQVELGAEGQVVSMTPIRVGDDTADAVDYINFVQCAVTERWQIEPLPLPGGMPTGSLLMVDVIAEASGSAQ